MDLFNDVEFENEESRDVIGLIVDKATNYDIYDFISRLAGLNLLSENQNKAVLTDTLIQYILGRSKEIYKSTIKMSDKRFKSLVEDLNSTFLAASVDPCENTFVQNVMLNGGNHRVFNGIDITPAYNMQSIIRVLFGYQNDYNPEYLEKINRLFTLILGLSEETARNIGAGLDNAKYSEEHGIVVPSSEIVKRNANCIRIPLSRIEGFIAGCFELDELCSSFGEKDKGKIDDRPFYTKPFIVDEKNNVLIILNISLLPTFALYKAFEWASHYGIKEKVINRYNEYVWLESKKTLEKMGHKKIQEKAYGMECVSKDFFREAVLTVYNNQLMIVFYICDDGYKYSNKTIHDFYPDNRHYVILQERLNYYKRNLGKLEVHDEDVFVIVILNSIGRALKVAIKEYPFFFKPIIFNPFELHCLGIHEHENLPFLPRYIRAKSQLRTMGLNLFSELNDICIYASNNNSFYINDEIDTDEIEMFIAPGDSIEYITEALSKENRILIDSYNDGNMMEVILADKSRNIYVEDQLFPEMHIAFCIVYKNIKIWIVTEIIKEVEQVNIYYSFVDAITYWLAECKCIIELYNFPFDVYTIHISLTGESDEFYYERLSCVAFEECIDQVVEKNHIYLKLSPESYSNLNQTNNLQEKELVRYILDAFDNISFEKKDVSSVLDYIFRNPLKKKFFSANYLKQPYLKPVRVENHRSIHDEDEDYLCSIIGKELLKTGKWQIGVVDDKQRDDIAKEVVGWLYNRLKSKVNVFKPAHMLEIIYHDLEETLYRLMLAERRYYSDIACYPENEDKYIREYNNLNKTSMSLKFLIEYVTACPPSGTEHFGIGQYEEILAICSMIIDWAYKGDLFYYNIVNTPVEFLKSKRIGMRQDEFTDMHQYNERYRRRQLKYDSSYALRKEYKVKSEDFGDELETAFFAEFGYTYSDFIQVLTALASVSESDVICVLETDLTSKLLKINDSLSEELINKVLKDITYCPRKDYLKVPTGFEKTDAYPWRFNRKYSFNRRPVLIRGKELIWGNRQVYHMAEYLTDLIYSGKFKANSEAMKTLCGEIAKARGATFNDLIVQMIKDMDTFKIDANVKKVNGIKISGGEGDLGDIDILIIDEEKGKIIVTEVKNLRFSRNPYEIQQEFEKMFLDKEGKPCFATKHNRRMKWVEDHIDDVKVQYGLDDRTWIVTSLFIVNQSLISQHIYKQNIKCISKAELSVKAIREV